MRRLIGLLAVLAAGWGPAWGPAWGAVPSGTVAGEGEHSSVAPVGVEPPDERFVYFAGARVSESVPSPEQGLGHRIGDRFTRHAQMVSYLGALASSSDRVQMREYGRTPQGRTLTILTISSPSNLARLDEILEDNRSLAEPASLSDADRARVIASNPAVAWLSYNVHGNEASASEAAIQVAYTLASSTTDEVAAILDDLVIVIDPMLNPDGRERYVSWYQNTRGVSSEAHPDASEHHEPWPGGRSNHYLFDLNRDWVWLVQPESQQRLAIYREYLPQLHIDYHEQEYTRPYFFGSGDDPYNTNLPPSLREWTDRYGEANAAVFDARGLLYSTKERFDYLYPGYGKVLPCYHGAVGMLCEQAGHSRAGLAIEVTDSYTLTLGERARNHFLTSMSYLESTASFREAQLERFAGYFRESAAGGFAGDETEWGFVISADSPARALAHLRRMCYSHGIRVERLASAQRVAGLEDYWSGRRVTVELPAGSWVIPVGQPMGRLVKALFERDPRVDDIETYDITAWSLPMCFGLQAWYTYEEPKLETAPMDLVGAGDDAPAVTGEGGVALVVSAVQDRFYAAMGVVASESLEARLAGEPFRLEGRDFPAGSLIVHLVRNAHVDETALVDRFVSAGVSVHRAAIGMTESGPVLGANANRRATAPTVLLLRGSALSSLSFGQHWHLLDVAAPMDHTVADLSRIRSMDLQRYSTIVLPDGTDLERAFRSEGVDRLKRWMRGGGVLIAVGRSGAWANRTLADAESEGDDAESDDDSTPGSSMTYEQRRRQRVERRVSGALFRGVVDLTHPLSAGLGEDVAFLKRSTRRLPVSESGQVVVRYHEKSPHVAGVVPRRTAQRFAGLPAVTYHAVGSGGVISFCDDPTIRGFMHGPVRVLLNAVLYGASL